MVGLLHGAQYSFKPRQPCKSLLTTHGVVVRVGILNNLRVVYLSAFFIFVVSYMQCVYNLLNIMPDVFEVT